MSKKLTNLMKEISACRICVDQLGYDPNPVFQLSSTATVLELMPNIKHTLLIGSYAINWHLGKSKKQNLTETVKAWEMYAPNYIPLPHPSPRNNIWLKKNAWFEAKALPNIRKKIQSCF